MILFGNWYEYLPAAVQIVVMMLRSKAKKAQLKFSCAFLFSKNGQVAIGAIQPQNRPKVPCTIKLVIQAFL